MLNERHVSFQFLLNIRIGEINCFLPLRGHVAGHAELGNFESVAQRQKAIAVGEKSIGGIFMLVGFVVVSLLNGAVNGIFQASLYHFATTGNAGPFIDTGIARDAFG